MGAKPWGLAAVASTALLVGCGGSSDKSSDKTSSTAKSTEGPPPAALVGTYTTTLKKSDLPPNPPQELTNHAKRWQLRIATTGGNAGGPAFTIVNPTLGPLESPSLGVTGNTVALHTEECAPSNSTVDSFYTYTLKGKQLTFKTVKNGCSDKVAETILTSEPWVKSG